jgi:hypothetical protein
MKEFNHFFKRIKTEATPFKLDLKNPLLFAGSCFVQNLHKSCKYRLLDYPDPFLGTLYNPVSIANSLNLLTQKELLNDSIFLHPTANWVSWLTPTRWNQPSSTQLKESLQRYLDDFKTYLSHAEVFIFSLGTTWAWQEKSTGLIVANCHKMPQNSFHRIELSQTYMHECFSALLEQLWKLNPTLKVIFTVSPIRYPNHTAHQHTLAKAKLHLLVEQLLEHSNTGYFPAYEIMLDELRDYRFYDKDRVHPSEEAIEWILQEFSQNWFTPNAQIFWQESEKSAKRIGHRTSAAIDPAQVILQELQSKFPEYPIVSHV